MEQRPAITAPVMRWIGVQDTTRSAAFYRDILGFQVHEQDGATEVVSGPARIRFGTHDYDPNDWDNPRPAGSAMLLFQTDDITAMHTAIRAAGGEPSEIQKVNWIKMRFFEIRDPDGHRLWFGQSYDFPTAEVPPPMMRQVLPCLPLDDVAAGVAHYRDVLGFQINYQQEGLGVIYRDKVTLLLTRRTDRHKGIGAAYVYIEDADVLYAELQAKGAKVQGKPVSQVWGLREFLVLDPEGNELTFGQPFE